MFKAIRPVRSEYMNNFPFFYLIYLIARGNTQVHNIMIIRLKGFGEKRAELSFQYTPIKILTSRFTTTLDVLDLPFSEIEESVIYSTLLIRSLYILLCYKGDNSFSV